MVYYPLMGKIAVIVGVGIVIVAGVWLMWPTAAAKESSDAAKQQAAAALADMYYGTSTELGVGATGVGSAAAGTATNQPIKNTNNKVMQATLHTNKGDITIEFFGDLAPNTVANFVKLAKEGFYDGTKFHRVIKDFMIQGGDPLTKDDSKAAMWGTGGPGYKFADEIHAQNHNVVGTIAMANAGPNTNGSQFFINVADNSFLDGKHTVFGRVTAGMSAVQDIVASPTSAGDRPVTPIVITRISVQ